MKVVVTGAGGQLGTDLVESLRDNGDEVVGFDRAALDIGNAEQARATLAAEGPDWIVNCAAYTNVDGAESDAEGAFAVNRDGAANVAAAAAGCGARLVHVSTDYVFDGNQSRPWQESDPASPLGIYGQSKWAGEQAVRATVPGAVILRTAWVYGAHGRNFAKTILRLAAERDSLSVIDDQVGCPTWTGDICTAIAALIGAEASGIYHFTNEGVASWYDFATAIVEEGRTQGFDLRAGVHPIPTEDYPLPAPRPAYSVLSKRKIRPLLDAPIPHWRASLRAMLKELKACADCS
ncbi:MAG: dTDP-4-dehydrorhamnose reductase [Gammaproteobacteria bacterium]